MLGYVLSGGGARGAFEAGAYARLSEDERFARPAVLAGTSAGAINAALIANGKTVEQIRQFWLDLGSNPPATANTAFFRDAVWTAVKLLRRLPFPASPKGLGALLHRIHEHWFPDPGNALALAAELLLTRRFDLVDAFLSDVPETALFETRLLRERLVGAFGGTVVRTNGTALALNAVNVLTHEVARFINRPIPNSKSNYIVVDEITVDMVLSSASIPLLFPPVRIATSRAGRASSAQFWDGGVLVNTPMAPAVALGADTIVPILCTRAPHAKGRGFDSVGDALEQLADTLLENSYNVDRKLLLERNRTAEQHPEYRKVKLLSALRPQGEAFSVGSYLYFDPTKLEQMYDLGLSSAERWLSEGPPVDELP